VATWLPLEECFDLALKGGKLKLTNLLFKRH